MSDQVKRARSPNYPAISLPTAMQQLRSLFDRIQKHRAPKDAVLKGLGYGGWNGASATALSAHAKYGLLERLDNDEFKISELGMRLMFHRSPQEYTDALIEAAGRPPLFAELIVDYDGTVPHDDILRSRLIRQGFAQAAVATVIDSFRDTMEFVSSNSSKYTVPEKTSAPEAPLQTQVNLIKAPVLKAQMTHETPPEFHVAGEPFRVSFTGKGIEITAKIVSAKDADNLVDAINALKLLLKPTSDFQRPKKNDDEMDNED